MAEAYTRRIAYNITPELTFDVNRGAYPGVVESITQSAYQTANTATLESDIWSVGGVAGSNLTWFQAATQLEVLSSNAGDTNVAGAGARTIIIVGLDANWNQIVETIALNGVTPVPTVNSFLRVNRSWIATSGTWGGANLGLITIRGISVGASQGYMPIQSGRIAKSHFSVPAGKTFLFSDITMAAAANKPCTFKAYIRDASIVAAPFGTKQLGLIYHGVQGVVHTATDHLPAIPQKFDIWMTATPDADNTALSSVVHGMMYTK